MWNSRIYGYLNNGLIRISSCCYINYTPIFAGNLSLMSSHDEKGRATFRLDLDLSSQHDLRSQLHADNSQLAHDKEAVPQKIVHLFVDVF